MADDDFEEIKAIFERHQDGLMNHKGVYSVGISKNERGIYIEAGVDSDYRGDLPMEVEGVPILIVSGKVPKAQG